jgi:hypothetical protein
MVGVAPVETMKSPRPPGLCADDGFIELRKVQLYFHVLLKDFAIV